MAKWKSGAGSPTTSQRIDGLVYSVAVAPKSLFYWQYPLAHPSPRFTDVNERTRELDGRFDAFTSSEQEDWYLYAQGTANSCPKLCAFDFDPSQPLYYAGKQAHRTVNLLAADADSGYSATPPPSQLAPSALEVSITTTAPYLATWSAFFPPPADNYYLTVYTVPTLSGAAAITQARKIRWSRTLPIVEGVPLDITPEVESSIYARPNGRIIVLGCVNQSGRVWHTQGFAAILL